MKGAEGRGGMTAEWGRAPFNFAKNGDEFQVRCFPIRNCIWKECSNALSPLGKQALVVGQEVPGSAARVLIVQRPTGQGGGVCVWGTPRLPPLVGLSGVKGLRLSGPERKTQQEVRTADPLLRDSLHSRRDGVPWSPL